MHLNLFYKEGVDNTPLQNSGQNVVVAIIDTTLARQKEYIIT